MLAWPSSQAPLGPRRHQPPPPAKEDRRQAGGEQTIRMDVARLENLLTLVGELALQKNRVGAMTHLFPRGSLVGKESRDVLRAVMEESIAANEIQLIVDMVSVPMVNSKTLELFLDVHQSLMKNGGWLKLTNAKPIIRDIFR